MMNIKKNTLYVGAQEPFCAVHISDTHLTYADERERDNGRKLALAQARLQGFPDAEENLKQAVEYVQEHKLPILHTGDLIDFVSAANLDAAKKLTEENDVYMAAGNHEFSLYVGEAKEDAAYRNQSLDKVQACFDNDIRFSSRVMHGVNFVAVDNSYYLFEEWQLEALKKEVQKGMPIVLMMHTPLYTETLYEKRLSEVPGPAYLMSVPVGKMAHYNAHRFEQQLADEVTRAAYDYIVSQPLIRAVLTGHLHNDADDVLPNGVPQLVTGCETLRHIRFE